MSISITGITNFTNRKVAGDVFGSDMFDAMCFMTDDCYFQCLRSATSTCNLYCKGGSLFRAIQIITLVLKLIALLESYHEGYITSIVVT